MFTIFPAQPRDLRDIQKMIQALSAFHGDTATVTLAALQALFFDGGPATALLAKDGSATIGYAGLLPHVRLHTGKATLDIQHLYVAEPHRGRGIGRALIAAAADLARGRDCFRITIGTDPANSAAQAAYRALGLAEITNNGPRFQQVF